MVAPPTFHARAIGVAIQDEALVIRLEDGRQLAVPLAWFPRLAEATDEQRANWQVVGRGVGIHWPDLDEDLSIAGMLGDHE